MRYFHLSTGGGGGGGRGYYMVCQLGLDPAGHNAQQVVSL